MSAIVKGHIEHELLLRNEYLAAENEILKSKLEGRLLFTTAEKVRLSTPASRSIASISIRSFTDRPARSMDGKITIALL